MTTRKGELMDQLPNMYTEIGAVIAELGRQPRAAKAFLTKYQDRVLFGKWSGTEVKIDGTEYLIMKESDILGIIENEKSEKKTTL